MKRIFKLLLPVVVVTAMFYSCQKEDVTPLRPVAGEYLLPLTETADLRGHCHAYNKERLRLLDGDSPYQEAIVSNLQLGKPIHVSPDMME